MATAADGHLMVLGDVHGDFRVIAAQLDHARHDLGIPVARIVVAGDLGLFGSDLRAFFRRDAHRFPVPVDFVEGNHEDFEDFEKLVRDYADVITHLPRATVQRLGRWEALCLGGARYMDAWTTPPGSVITERDLAACLQHPADSVHLVISHDCPCGIGVTSNPGMRHYGTPGVPGMERVAAHLRPGLWFFGHHHRWHARERDGTRYIGLPESWHGYCLLDDTGEVRRVEHAAPVRVRSRWWRLLGMR